MKLKYSNNRTGGVCNLSVYEGEFDRAFYGRDRKDKHLTIAWNRGEDQYVYIDEVRFIFPAGCILCLMINQSFRFTTPSEVVAWQFNRDFYCIEDHDKEVSCVGFIFYGSDKTMFIQLDTQQQKKLNLLLEVFIEEFGEADDIKEDMLRMLLKRLIIIVTRIAKQQFITEDLTASKLDIVRKYNILVERNFKTEHSIKFYADQLNKSPKTLSNLFALYNHKSPLTVIKERITLEAKRLLIYTDKSSKEIAYELGFEDVAYFSNFFKKMTSVAPTVFRKDTTDQIATGNPASVGE